MADGVVVPFPDREAPAQAAEALTRAREAHLTGFEAWLRQANPSRDDAELEIEVFAASARQMVQLYTRRGT